MNDNNNNFFNNEPVEYDEPAGYDEETKIEYAKEQAIDSMPEFAVDESSEADETSDSSSFILLENTGWTKTDNSNAFDGTDEVNYSEPQDASSDTDLLITPLYNYQSEKLVPDFEYTASKEYKSRKMKKGRIGSFIRKSLAIAMSAALFGVIAGGTFQFVNQRYADKESSVQLGAIDETDSNYQNEVKNDKPEVVQTSSEVIIDSTDVSTVVENVMPSVVAINCTADSFYNYFGRQYSEESTGSGSGIIVGQNASEILIVTNNHVISGAKAIEIVFADGTTAKAELKGSEDASDIAVVSVNVNDLSEATLKSIKIATLGNSDNLKMGEMAIAIGNALGYGQSVTVGYISALNREVTVDNITLNLIQTDAAINPGNSGGALLNVKGEVIGINSLKYAQTDVEGIGFAIPISDVIPIINELMNIEKLAEGESGYLGILGTDITSDYATGFNMPEGVYVKTVQEGSPAEKAGLKVYDIITGIKGKTISNMSDLQQILSYTKAGTEVELKIMTLQDGVYVEKTLNVVLGSKPVQ